MFHWLNIECTFVYKLFQKTKKGGNTNSFYETSIALLLKQAKGIIRKKYYNTYESLM